jgi:hypothetical protein
MTGLYSLSEPFPIPSNIVMFFGYSKSPFRIFLFFLFVVAELDAFSAVFIF